LLPHIETAQPETREFLQCVINILLDYVNACNNRNEKILEFHHPEDMKKLLDLDINDSPASLQQLVVDCATTMKYQVKTGELNCRIIKLSRNSTTKNTESAIITSINAHQNLIFVCRKKNTARAACRRVRMNGNETSPEGSAVTQNALF
jgi:hypothetical protein